MSWKSRAVPVASSWKDRASVVEETPDVSYLESGARGVADTLSLGFADEATGALESLFTDKPYEQARDESRANYEAAQKANPLTYGAGQLGGAVGTAFIPGLGVANSAKLATAVGKSALTGGLAGLGTSTADLTEGDFAGAAKDTASGAALGAAIPVALHGAGKGIQKFADSDMMSGFVKGAGDKLDEFAELQKARAFGAERGTIKKLGADRVRETGRYGLDNNIGGVFSSTDDMIAQNNAVKSAAGQQMDNVFNTIDDAGASTFNPLDVATKVDEEVGGFWRSPLNRGETNQFENTIESILMRGEGDIPLREAQALKQELGKVANWKAANTLTDKERMAREAYFVVSKAIDDTAEKGAETLGIQGLKETLQKSKSLYSKAKSAEELLTNRFAREEGNKLFGLTDTITGAGAMGVMGPGAIGLVGAKKGLEKFGNNAAAIGANNISQIVKQSPQSLGKFAKVLQQAEQRGPQGVAATHFVLQSTNPEYREILKRAAGEDGNEGQ